MMWPETTIFDREAELASLAGFIESARDGPVAALIQDEAGVGKTTLWQAGVTGARDETFQVLSCRPAESESKLSYSALADLLDESLDDVLPSLADPQRRALEVALLRVDARDHAPDQRAVGLAFLGAIRSLATSEAVLLAVDDVQWLDSSSAWVIGFALRRLEREHIAVLATLRIQHGLADPLDLERAFPYPSLHQLRVPPLDPDALARLLRERVLVAGRRSVTVLTAAIAGVDGLTFSVADLGTVLVAGERARAAAQELACPRPNAGDPVPP